MVDLSDPVHARVATVSQPLECPPPSSSRIAWVVAIAAGLAGLGALAAAAIPSNAQVTAVRGDAQATLWQATHLARPPAPLMQNRRILSYPYSQVWPTAIRYLRVDRQYAITDRDEDAGYISFEFPVGQEGTGSGSLELIRATDPSGRESVNVIVTTGSGPAHLPSTIVDGLSAKVRDERGQPAPPPKADPPAPTPPAKKAPDDDGSHGDPPMLPGPIDP